MKVKKKEKKEKFFISFMHFYPEHIRARDQANFFPPIFFSVFFLK